MAFGFVVEGVAEYTSKPAAAPGDDVKQRVKITMQSEREAVSPVQLIRS